MYGKVKRRGLNMFVNLPQENEQILGNEDYLCPGRISHRMHIRFYSFFKKLRFWTPCGDAVCGGCCSGRLQQLHLVNRGRCLRTTAAQLHGKAEVRRIKVDSYIKSSSLYARGASFLRTAWRPPSADASGVYIPFYPLPKTYITRGRGWTRIP